MALLACSQNPLGGFNTASALSGSSSLPQTLPQTLKELIENAIDSRPSTIRITIVKTRGRQREHQVQVRVMDDGSGIDSVDKIVQMFCSTKAKDDVG